jgi:propanol-preferring alcohol dehydrogenase
LGGDTQEVPPSPLNAVIDTTPAWLPVLSALKALAPGGRLVINAIRKEAADHDVLNNLDYEGHLWKEKVIRTVANVTRKDVRSLLQLATDIPLAPTVTEYPLEHAREALLAIKSGIVAGAMVLRINPAEAGN